MRKRYMGAILVGLAILGILIAIPSGLTSLVLTAISLIGLFMLIVTWVR